MVRYPPPLAVFAAPLRRDTNPLTWARSSERTGRSPRSQTGSSAPLRGRQPPGQRCTRRQGPGPTGSRSPGPLLLGPQPSAPVLRVLRLLSQKAIGKVPAVRGSAHSLLKPYWCAEALTEPEPAEPRRTECLVSGTVETVQGQRTKHLTARTEPIHPRNKDTKLN